MPGTEPYKTNASLTHTSMAESQVVTLQCDRHLPRGSLRNSQNNHAQQVFNSALCTDEETRRSFIPNSVVCYVCDNKSRFIYIIVSTSVLKSKSVSGFYQVVESTQKDTKMIRQNFVNVTFRNKLSVLKSAVSAARLSGFKPWLCHLLGCVTQGKLLNVSLAQFPYCQMRKIIIPTSLGYCED